MHTIVVVLFIVGYSCVPGDAAATKKQHVDGTILFPETVQKLNFIDKDKDDPPSCKGQTYCTIKTDDYPEKKFNEMFKGYKGYPQPQLLLDPLQNKQGDPNDKNDCASDVTLQITHGADIGGRFLREGDRSVQNTNGSYKILNRFAKPLVRRQAPGGMVFPDEKFAGMGVAGFMETVIPDACRKIGICDDVPNYPEELVSRLIQQIGKTNLSRFNQDVLEIPTIAQRISPEEDTMSLCDSVEKIYAPRAAQDTSKEWHLIVNEKKDPQQKFRIEICRTKESPCSSVAYFQNGYEARCVQKFMLRKMLALNENKEIVERPFQVPSCCSCIVRNIAN